MGTAPRSLACALAFASMGLAGRAHAQETGDVVRVEAPVAHDLYLGGRHVEVAAPVDGDVVAAGRSVRIGAETSGDVVLAGSSVVVAAPIGDDVRAAGADVVIAAPVEGHLVAAGETVSIVGSGAIHDWAWVAGERVRITGSVGSLRAVGDTVTLGGEVRGDADLQASTIRLAPGTIVHGDLRWSSPGELIVGEGARVDGELVRRAWEGGSDRGATMVLAFAMVVGLVVSIVLLVLVAPRGSRLVAARARMSAGRSLAVGTAVLVLTPLVALLALVSGVLWIIGLVLLAGYVLALLLGALLGVVSVADLALELRGRPVAQVSAPERAATTALVSVVLAGIVMVPVIGPIVIGVLTILGVGALVLSGWRAQRASAQRDLGTDLLPV